MSYSLLKENIELTKNKGKNNEKETKELESTFRNNKHSQTNFGKIPAYKLQVSQNTTFSFFVWPQVD